MKDPHVITLNDRIDQILAQLEKVRTALIFLKSESEPRDLAVAIGDGPVYVIDPDGNVTSDES
jgi:hypothetical protein